MFRVVWKMVVAIATVITVLGSYGINTTVWAAGSIVDCAKAHTWAEQNICRNRELANLDVQMTTVFARLRDALSGEERTDQIFYQRGFLKGRDICRTQTQAITGQECLRRIYQDRIAELESYLAMVSGGAASAPVTLNDCRSAAAHLARTAPCLQLELDKVNADLKLVAEDMRVRMHKMDRSARDNISAENRFTSSQEAFLKFRQASCEWRSTAMADVNDAKYTFLVCMVDLALTRMAEIETVFSDWQLQNPK